MRKEFALNLEYLPIFQEILSYGVELAQEEVGCHARSSDRHWAISAVLPDGDKTYFHRCDWAWRASSDRAISMEVSKFDPRRPREMLVGLSDLLAWSFLHNHVQKSAPIWKAKYSPISDTALRNLVSRAEGDVFDMFEHLPYLNHRVLFGFHQSSSYQNRDSIEPSSARLAWASSQGATKKEIQGFWGESVVNQLTRITEMIVFTVLAEILLRQELPALPGETNVQRLERAMKSDQDFGRLLPTFNFFPTVEAKGVDPQQELPIELFERASTWYLRELDSIGMDGLVERLGRGKNLNSVIRKKLASREI